MASRNDTRYPPIEDYAFIGDCHSAALVSRAGSIDWACMPRFDAGSCFGRLLDWDRGGYCSLSPVDAECTIRRRYCDRALVLETTFEGNAGTVRVYDCLIMVSGGADDPRHRLLRIIEGQTGTLELEVRIAPRFDYGQMRPWVRCHGPGHFTAIGGDDGLIIWSDCDLALDDKHDLIGRLKIEAGARGHLSIQYRRPERLDPAPPTPPSARTLDAELDETCELWRTWVSRRITHPSSNAAMQRSAMVLKALNHAPTGAIVAAPVTSLPEVAGGEFNFDFRYSWIRDSWMTVRTLGELGSHDEADGFRRFIQRSSAGHVEEVQVMYGVGGERRLTEYTLDYLEGYRGARPVRIGNAASAQTQFDMYGELLELAWRWAQRGHTPGDDYWAFLVEIVEHVAAHWSDRDHGVWEMRGEPQHFVFTKVMCWVALDRGIRLAESSTRQAPIARWQATRDEIRRAIESRGFNRSQNTFVQRFDHYALDAALALLPGVDFVAVDDARMIGTADAIMAELDREGLILRYDDPTNQNPFLPCTFWLAECLARQGRLELARGYFERALNTANDLGLFSEEYDVTHQTLLAPFPLALSHLSHISAALTLADL